MDGEMMTIWHDWRLAAASEILTRVLAKSVTTDFTVADIIEKHCPIKTTGTLKTDVPLMPVPRCETCKHWQKHTCCHENVGQSLWKTEPDFGCVQWEAR